MNTNDDKHGLSGLSNLVSDTEQSTQSKAAQNSLRQSAYQKHDSKKLPGKGGDFFGGGSAKEKNGILFFGISKFLLAIPWQLYLIGSVVPIDLASRTVNNMVFRIKEDNKPKSTDEISFVAGFNCSDQVTGSYSEGAYGYQKNCDHYITAVRSHTWTYAGNFNGSEPPISKKGGGSRAGSHPASDYLRKAGVM